MCGDGPIAMRKEVTSLTKQCDGQFVSHDGLSPTYKASLTTVSIEGVPQNIHEALKQEKWRKATHEDLNTPAKSCPGQLVKLPEGKKNIGV